MPTRQQTIRMPDGLENAVRAYQSELADEPFAFIVRVALLVLLGWPVSEAVRVLRGQRSPTGRIKMPAKPPDRTG